MIDFFVVKVFMVLLDRYHCWKRTAFPFVVRNEQRFKNLHGVVGNKERFSDKKFLNVIAYLQSEILIFLVFVSLGDLTFFLGDITKISGNMTQFSGDMTSGDLTGYRCNTYKEKWLVS